MPAMSLASPSPLLPHHGFQDRSMSLLFQGFHSVADGTEQFDVLFPLLILRSFSWVPLPEKVASAPGVLDDGPFFCGNFFCNAVPRLSSTPKRSGDSDAGSREQAVLPVLSL